MRCSLLQTILGNPNHWGDIFCYIEWGFLAFENDDQKNKKQSKVACIGLKQPSIWKIRDRNPLTLQGAAENRVELFSLMAVYLQNADRKDEAYIHVSWFGLLFLWLALALGSNISNAGKHSFKNCNFAQVPSAFRNKRLVQIRNGSHQSPVVDGIHAGEVCFECQPVLVPWKWSNINHKRRLAAATGNPSGVSEKCIELNLPIDALGFAHAAPIRVNIQMAQVTGQILRSTYFEPLRRDFDPKAHCQTTKVLIGVVHNPKKSSCPPSKASSGHYTESLPKYLPI